MQIAGASAAVTGAASGLGRATVLALASRGCEVFALDLPAAVADAEPISGVTHLPVDVTDSDQVAGAFSPDRLAVAPLRGIVNCAGIAPSERVLGNQGVRRLERFIKAISVNLVGTFAVMAHAAAMSANRPDSEGQR